MALSGEMVGHCTGDTSAQKAGVLVISLFGRHFSSRTFHIQFSAQLSDFFSVSNRKRRGTGLGVVPENSHDGM